MSFEPVEEERGLGPFIVISILLHGVFIVLFPVWQAALPAGFQSMEKGGVVQVLTQGVPGGQPPKKENSAAVVAEKGKPADKSRQEGEKQDEKKSQPPVEKKSEPKPQVKPEAVKPKSEPKPAQQEKKPATAPKPEVKPAPQPKPEPRPQPQPKPEPKPEAKQEAKPEPTTKPEASTPPKETTAVPPAGTPKPTVSRSLTSERGPEVVVPEAEDQTQAPAEKPKEASTPPKAELKSEPKPEPAPAPKSGELKNPTAKGSEVADPEREAPGENRGEGGPKQGTGEKDTSPGVAQSPPPPENLVAGGGAPMYPKTAQDQGSEGTVTLEVRVSKTGTTESVTVARSSNVPVLDRTARLTVEKTWTFKPEISDYIVVIEVTFVNQNVEVRFLESRYL